MKPCKVLGVNIKVNYFIHNSTSFRPHSPTRVHFNEENNQYFSRPNSIYVDQINLSTIPNSDEPDVVRTHSDQQQPQDAFENIAYIDDSSSSAENLDRASWHWCDVKLLSEIDVLDNAPTTFHRQAQKVSIYSFLVLSYTPCDLSNISTIYKALISNKNPFL